MIRANAATRIVWWYLCHGKEPLLTRVARCWHMLTRWQRRKHLDVLYKTYHDVPADKRAGVLAGLAPSPVWLGVVQKLRHDGAQVHVTVITRNSVDIVKEWLLLHGEALRAQNISVVRLIGNPPIDANLFDFVSATATGKVKRAGSGWLHLSGKKRFLRKSKIYIGDVYEEPLRGFVHEFVRV
jgi:hypothetical protein